MAIEYVTQEQFQTYGQTIEKEIAKTRLENKNNILGPRAVLHVTCTALAGGMIVLGANSEYSSGLYNAFMGVLTLLNAGYSYHYIKELVKNSLIIGNLEKTIEQLKSQQAHKPITQQVK